MPNPQRTQNGFTLIDLLITVTIIGILAAIVIPFMGQHIDQAEDAAALTGEKMVAKGINLYYQKNSSWPATLDEIEFVADEAITMPKGYQLQYNPNNGVLTLVELAPEDVDGALAYININ
jgi:prepilin-type N-terminal cleavage/methylation domain-containing protein